MQLQETQAFQRLLFVAAGHLLYKLSKILFNGKQWLRRLSLAGAYQTGALLWTARVVNLNSGGPLDENFVTDLINVRNFFKFVEYFGFLPNQ